MSDQPLDLREQIVRIDKMIAETQKLFAERDKLLREAKFGPWQPIAATVGATAALIAAGVALGKLLFGTP